MNGRAFPLMAPGLSQGCGRRRFASLIAAEKAVGRGAEGTPEECSRGGLLHWHLSVPAPEPVQGPRASLRQVSVKRAAENRQRKAMAAELWPDGQPPCSVPWCTDGADDLHEPLTRARGGSITDPENAKPLCRKHHDMITFLPESELQWAYDLGLLVHSWNAPKAGDAA